MLDSPLVLGDVRGQPAGERLGVRDAADPIPGVAADLAAVVLDLAARVRVGRDDGQGRLRAHADPRPRGRRSRDVALRAMPEAPATRRCGTRSRSSGEAIRRLLRGGHAPRSSRPVISRATNSPSVSFCLPRCCIGASVRSPTPSSSCSTRRFTRSTPGPSRRSPTSSSRSSSASATRTRCSTGSPRCRCTVPRSRSRRSSTPLSVA